MICSKINYIPSRGVRVRIKQINYRLNFKSNTIKIKKSYKLVPYLSKKDL